MNISKYLEMRNLVLIEPETDEFVQVTYLCDMDSHMSESEILNRLGGLRDVGNANDKVFMSLGLYPVSIYYERDGRVMRSRENSMTDFEAVEDNVYRPKPGDMSVKFGIIGAIGFIFTLCNILTFKFNARILFLAKLTGCLEKSF